MSAARTTDWRADLRARGYRLTPQRELILKAVQELDHASPEDILAEVRRTAEGVNLSTVYRALELLEKIGLVSHTHLGHGAPAYHATTEPDHVHLVCRSCQQVTEAAPEVAAELVDRLADERGFRTDVRHLTLFGTCRDCTEPG
ncbi:MAG TPA: Fur family transcriptional regulator [Jiangellaceae bacterium]|nr:Fur family transcriptional regulator [Jiangellaceae bacterium]